MARLDRKIDAAARTVPPHRPLPGGFIELPEMQRRATEVSSRRKELQHKRTSLADERTALARDNQLRRRVHDLPPASTPSSTPSTTPKNHSCSACSSKTSASPAGTSRSGCASHSTRHHRPPPDRPNKPNGPPQPPPLSTQDGLRSIRRRLRRGGRGGRSWPRQQRRRRKSLLTGRTACSSKCHDRACSASVSGTARPLPLRGMRKLLCGLGTVAIAHALHLGGGPPPTRIDILGTALIAVVGVGGAVALVVAYRRQRDLEQGRFIERFGAAAARLGNHDPAVRIAGV